MLKRTKLCTSLMIAFGSGIAAVPAMAQQTLERVEITGSAIKRIDAETAIPVTVLKVEDLKKQGITTVEQIIANVSAVQIQQGTSQMVGSGSGGSAFADVRGIGFNKTLVLLNGRRLANNAFDSSAPDLNMIPFAAIERVEVLRDGASALYGTDAIGGVINFITRRDYTGITMTLGADRPQHPGGKSYNGNFGFGAGDLAKDGVNFFGFLDFQHQSPIGGTDRPFNTRIPGGLSPTPFPANYFQDDASGNPAAQLPGGCTDSVGLISDGGTGCQLATASFVNYVPRTERFSGLLKGSMKLGDSHTFSLEYFMTRNQITSQIAPVPYGGLFQNRTRPDGSLNPYYPGNPGSSVPNPNIPLSPTFFPADPPPPDGVLPGFVNVKFRDLPNGPRQDTSTNRQQRLVAALEGNLAGWDYQVAGSYNTNSVRQDISGYSDGPLITDAVLNGIINPFGPQSAAGTALLNGAGRAGTLQSARGTVETVDAHASRDMGDWFGAGRPAALAIGAEATHQKFDQHANFDFASVVVASTGIDPNTSNVGSRNIYAGFAELNVPIFKMLDVTAAIRYDKYSDFGNTTNPKVSFRFQPIQQALLRGSYSTGFRAPSLFEINAAQAFTNTSQLDDPVRCPGGTPIPGAPRATNCNAQFEALTGGNTALKPEKSKNATLGIVVEPVRDLSLGVDYFWISVKQTIGSIPDTTLFSDPTTFAAFFHRLPSGQLSTDGSQCPNPATCGYVDLRTNNLGGTITSGLDLSGQYRLRAGGIGNFTFGANSTYVLKYKYQDFENGPWNQNVGVYVGAGPIFRWQHNANVTWASGPFGAGVAGHYKSGYDDQDPTVPPGRVASYTTFDVFGSWAPTKELSLIVGVRNVFDRDPPFSNQVAVFQAGYDPRFADPTGRVYYARGTYSF